MRLLTLLALLASPILPADIYYLLWFDTEDWVEPTSDDSALRLARDLESVGVRATFKVVGEKARVLERRGRTDVIRALSRHDIGYHAETHSIPPAPATYMKHLGMIEGAEEFERREGQGVRDIERIFGVTPSCYGQPGSSWGPQSTIALRRLGIPAYMDEGSQVGFEQQPFWYGGILFVFNLRQFNMRAELNDESKLGEATAKFDAAVAELERRGGGVIHTYYHPTEFSATEFWDAVNFSKGRYTPPGEYKKPNLRTPESRERAHRILMQFVEHVRKTPSVRIITARQLTQIFATPVAPVDREAARQQLRRSIDIMGPHSAADLLLAVLGINQCYVDGPTQRKQSNLSAASIPRELFERGKRSAIEAIERQNRLPSHVWFGSEFLSLADFAATAAWDDGGPQVAVKRGELAFERQVATDGRGSFNWAIHPDGFDGSELLELGRLQAWTLKPAKLR
ncbi:MAG: hypothetical protein U0Q16_08480 [Bryobacteraceae bacterium]